MSQPAYYIPVAMQPSAERGVTPARAAGWLVVLAAAGLLALSALFLWRWVDTHILSLGIEDAGTTTVNRAQLLERVRTFELVTLKDTYDSSSNVDFKKRLNLGLTKVGLPGWVAGQELDVRAKVTVAAGVDLSQVGPEDIEVIQQGANSIVVVRIPQAQITSASVDPDSFDISTSSGVLTRLRRTIGLGEKDVRDLAVAEVVTIAREQALSEGIIEQATIEARQRLQGFLQALPVEGRGEVTFMVELQAGQ